MVFIQYVQLSTFWTCGRVVLAASPPVRWDHTVLTNELLPVSLRLLMSDLHSSLCSLSQQPAVSEWKLPGFLDDYNEYLLFYKVPWWLRSKRRKDILLF